MLFNVILAVEHYCKRFELFVKLVLTCKFEYPKRERLEAFRMKCLRKIAIIEVYVQSFVDQTAFSTGSLQSLVELTALLDKRPPLRIK